MRFWKPSLDLLIWCFPNASFQWIIANCVANFYACNYTSGAVRITLIRRHQWCSGKCVDTCTPVLAATRVRFRLMVLCRSFPSLCSHAFLSILSTVLSKIKVKTLKKDEMFSFKRSTIIPIPKKPKIRGLNHVRPVALTSVAMKSFERLVC